MGRWGEGKMKEWGGCMDACIDGWKKQVEG